MCPGHIFWPKSQHFFSFFLFGLAKLQWTSLYIYTAGMQLPRKESFSLGLKFNHSTLIDIITFCGTLFSPTRINVLVTKNMPVYSAWLAGKKELKQSLRNVDKFVFKNITLFCYICSLFTPVWLLRTSTVNNRQQTKSVTNFIWSCVFGLKYNY